MLTTNFSLKVRIKILQSKGPSNIDQQDWACKMAGDKYFFNQGKTLDLNLFLRYDEWGILTSLIVSLPKYISLTFHIINPNYRNSCPYNFKTCH